MNVFKKIFSFYKEGFLQMKLGKRLWTIILIKLFIMFALLKMFFFHDFLDEKCKDENEKSSYVMEQLTK